MESKSNFDLFIKNRLFSELDNNERETLYSISKEINIKKGDVLIHENQMETELFIIISGTLEITKYNAEENGNYIIETLSPGDVVGELAFIDRGSRSATVKATTDTTVRSISFDALEKFVNQSTRNSLIYVQFSKNVTQKLRNMTIVTLKNLKSENRETIKRVKMGTFLLYLTAMICIFSCGLNTLKYLLVIAPNSSDVTFPLTLLLGVSLLAIMKSSKLSWNEFGVKLTNWRQAILDGLLLPIPVMAFGVLVKWLMIQYYPYFKGRPLFEPFALISESPTWEYWITINLFYVICIVPLQELLARGALQGLLEYFLTTKYKVVNSIFISNLIFSTVHLFLPIYFSLIVFISGLYMGWIYSRTHNLISSCIAHAIMGVWCLSVIGAIFK